MAWKKVTNHDLAWHIKKEEGKGVINLIFKDGTPFKLGPLTSEDYSAIVDILHSGKPVWCEDKLVILRTGKEEPKEMPTTPKKTNIPEVASFHVGE